MAYPVKMQEGAGIAGITRLRIQDRSAFPPVVGVKAAMKHEQNIVADPSQVYDERYYQQHEYYEDDYAIEPPSNKRTWLYVLAIAIPIIAFEIGRAHV